MWPRSISFLHFCKLGPSQTVAAIFVQIHDPRVTLTLSLRPVPLPSAPPISLSLSGTVGGGAKKRLAAPALNVSLSRRDSCDPSSDGFAALSASPDETPSLDINLEALETPSDSETGTLPDSVHELEWDGEKNCVPLTCDP